MPTQMLRLSRGAIRAFVARARGVDAMVGKNSRIVAASLVTLATLAAPAVSSAQGYGYGDRSSVVVECGRGQRAVMEQRQFNGRTRVVARCKGARDRGVVYDDYGRSFRPRESAYGVYAPVARRSTAPYAYREPRRSNTKSALMIAGAAAAGAGVGGALKGTTGALVGAAIGGGSASLYEAAKRR
jgi:hypothetical protein